MNSFIDCSQKLYINYKPFRSTRKAHDRIHDELKWQAKSLQNKFNDILQNKI